MRIHPLGSIQYIDCHDGVIDFMTPDSSYRFCDFTEAPSGVRATLYINRERNQGTLRVQSYPSFSSLTFSLDHEPDLVRCVWMIEFETWRLIKPWFRGLFL